MVVKIMDYGGTITDILVPDKAGKVIDICPGFDSLQGMCTLSVFASFKK